MREPLTYLPSPEEENRVSRAIEELTSRLQEILPGAEIRAGGSTARGTFLKGSTDIDLFILDRSPREAFRKIREAFPQGKEKKGDLYIWDIKWRGMDVDLVVVPENSERWYTLDHTEILGSMPASLKNEARKLKALFKTFGTYGAENGGITGVACEALVLEHGSAEAACDKLVEGAFWLQDPAATRKGEKRNLLASIVPEKWGLIKEACLHLKRGDWTYSPAGAEQYAEIRRRQGFDVVILPSVKGQKDRDFYHAYGVCHKLCRILKAEEGIDCWCDAYADGRKVAVAFRVEPEELPPTKVVCLPPNVAERHKEAFKRKHPDWFVRDGRICAEVKRGITNVKEWYVRNLEQGI